MNNNSKSGPTQLLSKLIACPSVNPNNKPVEGPPFGEQRLAELVGGMLREWGAEVTLQEVLPQRPNLIARFRGKDSSRSLMLDAHSDTVQVEDMSIPPFEPRVVDGRMYGRGACDDKGPMAAMLMGIRKVLDEDGAPPTDLCFVATCNEERGAHGASQLMASGFRADAAIVAECTDMAIVHAHKGVTRWRVKTHGVAGHSSNPAAGISAITLMNRLLSRIEHTLAPMLNARSHPLLGKPTVSVGTIHGGTQVNIIPALCEIEIDRRVLPNEEGDLPTEELHCLLEDLKREDASFNYSLEQIEHYPPLQEDRNGPLAQLVYAACERALGKAELAVAPWGANSGFFHAAGIPSVLFGPGSLKQAHTKNEFVELAQVEKAVDVYAEIIRSFACMEKI